MTGSPRRARRLALVLAGAALAAAGAGGVLFTRFGSQVARDPGLTARNMEVLGKLLERARQAEAAGDRGSAIAAYRFIVEVVGRGDSVQLQEYVAAARAGLKRLGTEPYRRRRGDAP